MRVDAHLHPDLRGYGLRKLLDELDRRRMDGCWLLSWEEARPNPHGSYIPLTLERVLEFSQAAPGRILPFYAPDPTGREVGPALDRFVSGGGCGLGELKVRLEWDDPSLDRLLDVAGRNRLPVVFHMQQGKRVLPAGSGAMDRLLYRLARSGRAPAFFSGLVERLAGGRLAWDRRCVEVPGYLADFLALEERLRRHPGVVFVGHGPLFWKAISADLSGPTYPDRPVGGEGVIWSLLEAYPNLYCDISGLSGFNALARDREAARRFLDRFAGKVLYGTDNYGEEMDHEALLDSLALPAPDRRRIMGETAAALMERRTAQ